MLTRFERDIRESERSNSSGLKIDLRIRFKDQKFVDFLHHPSNLKFDGSSNELRIFGQHRRIFPESPGNPNAIAPPIETNNADFQPANDLPIKRAR